MTIQFQGHVECVKRGPNNGTMLVIVMPEASAVAEEFITLLIPAAQASSWLVGNRADFTVYASTPRTPQIETPQQEGPVAG